MGRKKGAKAPTGRAAAKQKAKWKGSPNAGRVQNFFRGSGMDRDMLDDDDDDHNRTPFRDFSQNNTNTRNAPPRFVTNVKLPHQTISFVSASADPPIEYEKKLPKDAAVAAAEDSEDKAEQTTAETDNKFDDTIQTNVMMDTDVDFSEGAMAQMNLHSSREATGPDTDNTSSDVDIIGVDKDPQPANSAPEDPPLYFVDTVGDPSLVPAQSKDKGKRPVRRAPSPARSDSSEEVVVFHGRNKPVAPTSKPDSIQAEADLPPLTPYSAYLEPKPTPKVRQPRVPHVPHVTDGLLAELEAGSSSTKPSSSPQRNGIGWASHGSKLDEEVDPAAKWAPAPAGSWWKKGRPRPDLGPSPAENRALAEAPPRESRVMFAEPASEPKPEKEDAEDIITSLQEDWKATLRLKKQAKSRAPEPEKISLKSPASKWRGKRGKKQDNRRLRDPIDPEDEDAEEAAYDDYMANLAAQIDGNDSSGDGIQQSTSSSNAFKPIAVSGPSMVVDGEEIDDDEVLQERFSQMGGDDTSSASTGPIGQDMSEISDDGDENYSDLDSSELEDELEYTEREQWEDEGDLRQRRKDAMTDEQIARMFAKQEELGIHDDELVLEDGDYGEDVDGVGDVDAARAGLSNITSLNLGRSPNKHGMRRGGNRSKRDPIFPNASAFADTLDQYGEHGFDIMDFDRPSLRQTKKGRKGKLPEELAALSDDDLREGMADAWEQDRQTKRMKKAEREDLRSQGLLGSAGKKGKADFNQKYQYGMSVAQVHEELRIFMQDDGQQSRPFPPMSAGERQALHQVAAALNLKSKSAGSGNDRFPVLYKTSRSVYDPAMFDSSLTWVNSTRKLAKKFAGQNIKKKAPKAAKGRAGKGGGFDKAAGGLRNGEVVGAGAAEISKDSFGHKMMERMGWSKGMALGKDGEGRLLPVEQVMRSGKAGLG